MVLDSLASIGVSQFRILRREGITAMREHWRQTAWITIQTVFWVTLVLYGPIIIYSVGRTVYDDHQQLASKVGGLQEYAKNKADYDRRMKWAEGEVNHWQEAYQRATKGDTERKLSTEDESSLYDALTRVGNKPINQSFAKVEILTSCPKESHRFGYQLLQVFKNAHWQIPSRPPDKNDLDILTNAALEGITIFTDDPQDHGQFLRFALLDAHVDSQVVTLSQVVPHLSSKMKGTIIWVGEK
jgi:hypothetical protein